MLREPLRRSWLLEWRLPLCLQSPERLDDNWLLLQEIHSLKPTTLSMQLLLQLSQNTYLSLELDRLDLRPSITMRSTSAWLPGNSDT